MVRSHQGVICAETRTFTLRSVARRRSAHSDATSSVSVTARQDPPSLGIRENLLSTTKIGKRVTSPSRASDHRSHSDRVRNGVHAAEITGRSPLRAREHRFMLHLMAREYFNGRPRTAMPLKAINERPGVRMALCPHSEGRITGWSRWRPSCFSSSCVGRHFEFQQAHAGEQLAFKMPFLKSPPQFLRAVDQRISGRGARLMRTAWHTPFLALGELSPESGSLPSPRQVQGSRGIRDASTPTAR